jgi:hypothetical protein
MNDYAIELLKDNYEAVCEQFIELWNDEENTWDQVHELERKRDSLQAALIKLGAL